MYIYRQQEQIESKPSMYTVGYYNPNGEWKVESDQYSTDDAAARVNYLNGGIDSAHINTLVYEGLQSITNAIMNK